MLSDDEIVRLYKNGLSMSKIAEADGRSDGTIRNVLIFNNVDRRSRSESNKVIPDEIFVSLYNLGLSVSQVGRLLGVHPTTVIKRLGTRHFPLRIQGTAKSVAYTEAEFKLYFDNEQFRRELSRRI